MQSRNYKDALLRLIKDGHKWQSTDYNGRTRKPRCYFSLNQLILILISIGFVFFSTEGFSAEFANAIISSLSIFVGLFLAVSISIYDKFYVKIQMDYEIANSEEENKNTRKKGKADREVISERQRWNFVKQFLALTIYSVLIACIVIVMLIPVFLLKPLGNDWLEMLANKDVCCSFLGILLALYRVTTFYFLLDFFLIVIYAISGFYEEMVLNMNKFR